MGLYKLMFASFILLVSIKKRLEKNGQFRFTPPTHAMVAFLEALKEWEQEGGREVRCASHLFLLFLLRGIICIGGLAQFGWGARR